MNLLDPAANADDMLRGMARARCECQVLESVRMWAAVDRGRWDQPDTTVRIGRRTLTSAECLELFRRADGTFLLDLTADELRPAIAALARQREARSRGRPDGTTVPRSGSEDITLPGPYLDEETVGSSRRFGVAMASMTLPRQASCSGIDEWFGMAWDMMHDATDVGARSARNLGPSNLLWASIFPDPDDHVEAGCAWLNGGIWEAAAARRAVIPRPDILFSLLWSGGTFRPLESFTTIVFMAAIAGLRLTPTLFAWGGGSRFLAMTGLPAPTFGPDHQAQCFPPCQNGFDPFYWEVNAIGSGPFGPTAEFELDYQRLSLTLYAGENASPWLEEVCRRKCLAVAAFGRAIGLYFAWLDGQLAGGLLSVVPVVELGNEYDVVWLNHAGGVANAAADARRVREGSLHLATFHTMLASSVHEGFPAMKFRTAPLESRDEAYPSSVGYAALEWLAMMFTGDSGAGDLGYLRQVTTFLKETDRALAGFPVDPAWRDAVIQWINTCAKANFYWPPLPTVVPGDILTGPLAETLDPIDYVHEVDFHWYHCYDWPIAERYRDQSTLLAEAADLERVVLAPAARLGFSLRWVVSEIGFPHAVPDRLRYKGTGYLQPYGPGNTVGGLFLRTNESYQAAMLVRLFLTFWAAGASSMYWHGIVAAPVSSRFDYATLAYVAQWDPFTAVGLHNSVYTDVAYDRGRDAWRLPSWFSFRRLVAITNRAIACEVMLDDPSGLIVLRLVFGTRISGQLYPSNSYRYAYVAWKDFKVLPADTEGVFQLAGVLDGEYERLPLVPTVDHGTDVDALGFPNQGTVDWDGVPHTERVIPAMVATVESGVPVSVLGVVVYLPASDPTTNPPPLVLLTNGEWPVSYTPPDRPEIEIEGEGAIEFENPDIPHP